MSRCLVLFRYHGVNNVYYKHNDQSLNALIEGHELTVIADFVASAVASLAHGFAVNSEQS